jgi:hypothetical protein
VRQELTADILAPAQAGGENTFQYISVFHNFKCYNTEFPKFLQLLPRRSRGHLPRGKITEDALERVQEEGKSKARRERIFAAGKVEGIAEGTEFGYIPCCWRKD